MISPSQDTPGYYGPYGGAYIPEVLKTTVDELTAAFQAAKADPSFWIAYVDLLREYCGRPTPITHLQNLSDTMGGAQIYVKREDLNHTGAHKANNVMGQGLLVKRMGKTRGDCGCVSRKTATPKPLFTQAACLLETGSLSGFLI